MKGSIRFILGLLIVFGAAGADISTSTATIATIAAIGLIFMISGANAVKPCDR